MGLSTRFLVFFVGISLGFAAAAVPVAGLYAGTVPGTTSEVGHQALATEALRQVVVRVTGRRAAATEPKLASVYAQATSYAQTYRSPAAGQMTVQFDQPALDAALAAAGEHLWAAERPLTLVVLVNGQAVVNPLGAPSSPGLRREIERAASVRGLPVGWLPPLDQGIQQAVVASALAGRLDELVALAGSYGAEEVLLGRTTGGVAEWSWGGIVGPGTVVGSSADAIDELADHLGSLLATAEVGTSQLVIVVRGVLDAVGYAGVEHAITSVSGVSETGLLAAVRDEIRLRVRFRGDAALLARQVSRMPQFANDEHSPADGALHLVWQAP